MVASAPDLTAGPGRRRGLGPARLGVALAAILGVALAAGVVVYVGLGGVVSAVERIGWVGFAAYVAFSLAVFPITGAAWWVLAPDVGMARLATFTWGRLLREAASDILPFSALGGVIIGARGVVVRGVDGARAYGSLVWDLITEIVAQIVFLGLGVALLSAHLSGAAMSETFKLCFVVALGSAAVMITGMVLAQGKGLKLLDRAVERFAPSASGHVQGVREMVETLRRSPARLGCSVLLHFAGWMASSVGVWIVLRFMGADISLLSVFALESLLSAVKSAAFVAPSGVGVQEAAYAMLGQLFGLTPEVGLAVSLLKRAKDLVIGAPALVVWQAQEGRRLLGGQR